MARTRLGYRWHLRVLMANNGMFATSDLQPLLAARGITLSAAQVYRLVAQTPERLSLQTLVALCDILGCTPKRSDRTRRRTRQEDRDSGCVGGVAQGTPTASRRDHRPLMSTGCADCGRTTVALRGLDGAGGRLCSACCARRRVGVCASCHGVGRIVGRDPDGGPSCQACASGRRLVRADAAARERIIDAIVAAAPGAKRSVIIEVLATVTVHARSLRRIDRHLAANPSVFVVGPTHAHRTVGRFVDALIVAGVALTVSFPTCASCDRAMPMSQRTPLCSSCANKARASACAGCGKVALVHSRDDQRRPWCARCITTRLRSERHVSTGEQIAQLIDVDIDPAVLEAVLGSVAPTVRQREALQRQLAASVALTIPARRPTMLARFVRALIAHGVAIPAPIPPRRRTAVAHRCPRCGRPTPGRNSSGCRTCIAERAAARRGDCTHCGRGVPVENGRCGQCARWDGRRCDRCAVRRDLVAGTDGNWRCHRCLFSDDLDQLTAGTPPAWLVDLCAALRGAKCVASTHAWLRSSPGGRLLAQLAGGELALSHDTLDEHRGRSVERLRGLLIVVGALEPDERRLARTEAATIELASQIRNTADRRIVVSWLRWHALARVRRRAERGSGVVHSAPNLRRTIVHITAFVATLDDNTRCLGDCRQSDIDHWFAQPGATPATIAPFLRWAQRRHHLPANLEVPSRASTRSPVAAIDDAQRWEHARRLVHDDTIDPDDRIAGALVVLYAQTLTSIATLTNQQLAITDTAAIIDFATHQIELPEPFATLARQLPHRRHTGVADLLPTRWLFPADHHPDRHVTVTGLGNRLRRLGIQPRNQRAAAVAQLAREVPPALLADTIGITARTAAKAVTANGGNWTGYTT